ncbi:multidrug resistance-associated protein 11 isoform X2 [Wolffia australiana]
MNCFTFDSLRFLTALGLCANLLIILIVTALCLRNTSRSFNNVSGNYLKLALYVGPTLGAPLSFYEILLLYAQSGRGVVPIYHQWAFRCSQLILWMTIGVLLKCELWFSVICGPIFCFSWAVKVFLQFPRLSSSLKGTDSIRESFSFLIEAMFGILVIVSRIRPCLTQERKLESIEEVLLSDDTKDNDYNSGSKVYTFHDCWSLLTFLPAKSMLDLGVLRQLEFRDLTPLPDQISPTSCHLTFFSCWTKEKAIHPSAPSLLKVMYSSYGLAYLCLGLLKITNDVMGFIGPLLLNRLIWFLEKGSGYSDGYVLAALLGITSTCKSFVDTQYSFRLTKLKLALRSSVMTVIHQKCLQVSLAERSRFSEGEIQTFMSVDVERTANLCNSLHDIWSLPLQIGVALYLLYTQVKFAFVSGTVLTVLLIPVNKWIASLISRATEKMMKQKDERVRSTGEMLGFMKTLKIYAWERLFADRLLKRRCFEVKHLATRKYLDACCVFFWATTPTFFSLSTFGLFTLTGHPLNAATVFTCVALFNTLISPLNSFPWVINGLVDAMISVRRLNNFLSCPECDLGSDQQSDGHFCGDSSSSICSIEGQSIPNLKNMAVICREAVCVWSSSNQEPKTIVSLSINLAIPRGIFVAVIGEVGSGKSSMLSSLLGEMRTLQGSISCNGTVAYAPQVPWIMSGSLRDNILFGEPYDAIRFGDVLHACALDIDTSKMVGGDMAHVGEKGANLSGGQRARIALARALYQKSDIYFLDDVLSAVDAHVSRWILENAILGPLMTQTTRILCTHDTKAISAADLIIFMEDGSVAWSGNFQSFVLTPYAPKTMLTWRNDLSKQQKEESPVINSKSLTSAAPAGMHSIDISEEEPDDPEKEFRQEGKVKATVYKSYGMFCGWPIVAIILISAAFMQASRNGNDLWLSYWVDTTSESKRSTRFYLVILSLFCAVNSLLTLTRAFSFAYGGLHAATRIHSKVVEKLINAPVSFFNENPSGRILNRLSSDLYTIDDSLPFILNILLAIFINLVGIAVVLTYGQVVFLLLLIPFFCIFTKLQHYYRSTSRELRRLDSVARSPIYSSFTEAIDGSSTIRAFRKEELFLGEFMRHLRRYQQTSYSESIASLWLSLRLQLMAAAIVFFVALMAVVGSRGALPISFGTPGLVGLALSYAAPVVSLLSGFLTSFAETEKEMVSVERVLEYEKIPPEEQDELFLPPPDWPSRGRIEFDRVTLRYGPSLPAALSDVSFTIPEGMQVGIIGRTGAGKIWTRLASRAMG